MFDRKVYYLGPPCSYGHSYAETGLTLRHVSTNECVRCRIARNKRYYDEKVKKLAEDELQAIQHRERKARNQRDYYERRKGDPKFGAGRAKLRTSNRRAQARRNHTMKICGNAYKERWEQFGNACAYCGKTTELQIDHVIPVSSSGPNVLHNIAPCCATCNASKKDKEVYAWYRAQPFFSMRSWRRLKRLCRLRQGQLQLC